MLHKQTARSPIRGGSEVLVVGAVHRAERPVMLPVNLASAVSRQRISRLDAACVYELLLVLGDHECLEVTGTVGSEWSRWAKCASAGV